MLDTQSVAVALLQTGSAQCDLQLVVNRAAHAAAHGYKVVLRPLRHPREWQQPAARHSNSLNTVTSVVSEAPGLV